MDKRLERKIKLMFFLGSGLLCAMLFFLGDALFRDLWFDEALTIVSFMTLKTPAEIYHNYLIPNNQIIFTMLLKYWVEFCSQFLGHSNLTYRLPSFIIAFATLLSMVYFWRKRIGTYPAFLMAFCFACSLPFEIYSVAVRGYMLSFLMVMLSLEFAFRWHQGKKWSYALLYFLTALISVGTISSSIIAFFAIILFFMPLYKGKEYFSVKFAVIAAVPFIAMAIFYLPLLDMFLGVLALREGWSNNWRDLLTVYSGFFLSILPLTILCLAAIILCYKRKTHHRNFLFRIFIFLIPVPFILLRDPAPFPRVFFPIWPVWMFIIAIGAKDFLCLVRKSGKMKAGLAIWVACLTGVIFCVGIAEKSLRDSFSSTIVAQSGMDDYFSPYYVRASFKPLDTVKKINKITRNNPPMTYISFASGPYSFLFYGAVSGVPKWKWYFDNPDFKIHVIEDNSFAILSEQDNIDNFKKRFKIKNMTLISDLGFHQLYMVNATR